MKDWIEFAGVVALWLLGMAALAPHSWSVNCIISIAFVATLTVGIYGWRAILERRSGNPHYFRMTCLAVFLTLISLGMSALEIPSGKRFLLVVFAVALLVVLAVLAWRHRPKKPASVRGP